MHDGALTYCRTRGDLPELVPASSDEDGPKCLLATTGTTRSVGHLEPASRGARGKAGERVSASTGRIGRPNSPTTPSATRHRLSESGRTQHVHRRAVGLVVPTMTRILTRISRTGDHVGLVVPTTQEPQRSGIAELRCAGVDVTGGGRIPRAGRGGSRRVTEDPLRDWSAQPSIERMSFEICRPSERVIREQTQGNPRRRTDSHQTPTVCEASVTAARAIATPAAPPRRFTASATSPHPAPDSIRKGGSTQT
jgi:hypothetical protein